MTDSSLHSNSINKGWKTSWNLIENDNVWNEYLSPREQKFLYTLNYHSNDIRQKMYKKENFQDYTLSKVYHKWSKSMYTVFNQIIKKIGKINKNKKYKNKDDWWKKYIAIFKAVYKILTQQQHIVYVGITCIILSLFLHFIFITK
tara:strand:- start:1764 stop:2198 length:435 start_codon:yes stop_codon:yes gene_type:complete